MVDQVGSNRLPPAHRADTITELELNVEVCAIYLLIVYLSHASHDAEFLRADEALQHDPDGHVDVVVVDVVAQVHLRMRFRHADHRLDVTHCDRNALGRL